MAGLSGRVLSGRLTPLILGDALEGLLVSDAYAAYNGIDCAGGRQSCLAHLLRKSKEIGEELALINKAETLRKRLIPASREYSQLFAFIEHDGPPTNNHAERALRPLVIFRKVCMGTRSATGLENISVFGSLTQTAALQLAKIIDMFRALFRSSPSYAQDVIFSSPPEANPSG